MDVITEKDVVRWLRKEGYNIDHILDYIKYRNKKGTDGKWSIEEYAIANPEKNVNDIGNLNCFSNWMGWGLANDIPDTHSFIQYCHYRDLYEYPSSSNYSVYDKEYLGPGFAVFRSDNQQFFKIYTIYENGFINYQLIAKDRNVDNPSNDTREIVFQSSEGDPLYYPFKELHNFIGECIIKNVEVYRLGENSFKIEKSKKGYNLVIIKDIPGVKGPSDFIHLNIGNERNCSEWLAIEEFYNNVDNISDADFKGSVTSKVIKIRPRERR